MNANLLDYFTEVRQHGDHWSARCPSCDEPDALELSPFNGTAWLSCKFQCSPSDVLAAVGLTEKQADGLPLERVNGGGPTAAPEHGNSSKIVSATYREDLGRNESNGERWPVKAISQLSGDGAVRWLWDGFLAYGLVTDLYGLWKAGKTTLIGALLGAMGAGGELAGRPVRAGRALVVSEESEATWKRRASKMGIADHVHCINRPFKRRASWDEWRDFTTHLQGLACGYDLIVLDALPNLWPVNQENEAGEVLRALIPLQGCAEKSAVLLIRHSRKGDGTEATAGRGSGAISGYVDIIVEFRRYRPEEKDDTRRVLSVYSREEPFESVVEWDGEVGYRCIGEKAEASQLDRIAVLVQVVTDHPGSTTEELLGFWPDGSIPRPGRATIQSDLDRATEHGSVVRTGDGVKGSPYRWYPALGDGVVSVAA